MILNYKLNKPAGYIFDQLCSVEKFVAVHPVISKMEYAGENKYKVFETLKLGPISFSFTYPANVNIYHESKKVVMKAVVMKVTSIEMIFHVKECNGYAAVEEEIIFKTGLPVKSIMCRIFKKQHAQLFKNIDAVIPTH